MNANSLGLADNVCDVVLCIQNGISAFHVDQSTLLREVRRVTRSGGKILLSSYSEQFWSHRLEWFRLQAAHGLIGEIDEKATGGGVIVGKDGFHAATVTPEAFYALADKAESLLWLWKSIIPAYFVKFRSDSSIFLSTMTTRE